MENLKIALHLMFWEHLLAVICAYIDNGFYNFHEVYFMALDMFSKSHVMNDTDTKMPSQRVRIGACLIVRLLS